MFESSAETSCVLGKKNGTKYIILCIIHRRVHVYNISALDKCSIQVTQHVFSVSNLILLNSLRVRFLKDTMMEKRKIKIENNKKIRAVGQESSREKYYRDREKQPFTFLLRFILVPKE